MSDPFPLSDREVIDVSPTGRRRWRLWLIIALVVLLVILSRSLSIFLSAAWFDSLGFSAVYWYIFKLKIGLFVAFALLTFVILRGAFWLLERTLATATMAKRTILVNNQPIQISPERFVRPIAWILAAVFALLNGFAMKSQWQTFALYFNQAQAPTADPIFNKPLSFYLFSLPLYDLVSGWLITLAFVILVATVVYWFLALPQTALKDARKTASKRPFSAVSIALAVFLILLAARTYLSRFPHLWQENPTFSGITYTEANYQLPALYLVCIALLLAAAIALINAFSNALAHIDSRPRAAFGRLRDRRFSRTCICRDFIVNRMNLVARRRTLSTTSPGRAALRIRAGRAERVQAEPSIEALDLHANRSTLDNIRLWDWRRFRTRSTNSGHQTYYDFPTSTGSLQRQRHTPDDGRGARA